MTKAITRSQPGASLVRKAATWEQLEAAVAALIRARRSENTRKAYRADWQRWRDFVLSESADLAMPGLPVTTTFRDQLSQTHSPSSVARVLASLAFFYGALQAAGLVTANPFNRAWLPRPEVSELHKTPVIEDETVKTLEASISRDRSRAGKRDAAIVRVLYDTGLRRASIASMRRDQIRHEGGELMIGVVVKGGKERLVKLTDEAEAALNAWLAVAQPSNFVFPKRGVKDGHIALASINRILETRARAAGLSSGSVHPHRFRAAFITTAYDAHIYERDIQVAAHHSNASTTRGYDRGARGDDVFGQVSEFRKQKGKVK
jgi:site-specific recombinase XerD